MQYERILLDIDAQRDLFVPGGAFYHSGCRDAARQVRRLFAWAKAWRVPVISTVLRVRRDRIGPFGARPHCVEGGLGERKIVSTLLPRRIDFGLRNVTDLPRDLFRRYQQVIFEQRVTDIFAQSRLERLITELHQTTFVICGAGLAHGVFEAAVGLRSRGFSVIVAEDAALTVPGEQREMPMLRMQAKGVIFAPTRDIVAPVTRRPATPFRSPLHSQTRRQGTIIT